MNIYNIVFIDGFIRDYEGDDIIVVNGRLFILDKDLVIANFPYNNITIESAKTRIKDCNNEYQWIYKSARPKEYNYFQDYMDEKYGKVDVRESNNT